MNKRTFKNECHIHGELAADPIIRATATGKEVLNCTVVTKFKTFIEYHKVVIWPPLGSKVASLRKGDFVAITGRIQTSSWTDKQTGQKKYQTQIVAFQAVIPGESTEPMGGTEIAKALLQPTEESGWRDE